MYTTWVVPLRIAGYIADSGVGWLVSDWILNAFFIVDIPVNFFSAYFDRDLNLITSRKVKSIAIVLILIPHQKKIIMHYLFGWFLIDLCAIIPFDLIVGSTNRYQQLLRVTRISRLYSMLKLSK